MATIYALVDTVAFGTAGVAVTGEATEADDGAVATGLAVLLGLADVAMEGVEAGFPAAPAAGLAGEEVLGLEEAGAAPDAGAAVLLTRPSVRTAGLGDPSAGLGAAARMALGGLSPGIGFSTGILTVAFFVLVTPDTISSRMPSHLRAGFAQERSWPMQFFTISLNSGVLKTCEARLMVAATASASSGVSLSASRAPMWKPVTLSLTVSTRPPVEATTGTVPY